MGRQQNHAMLAKTNENFRFHQMTQTPIQKPSKNISANMSQRGIRIYAEPCTAFLTWTYAESMQNLSNYHGPVNMNQEPCRTYQHSHQKLADCRDTPELLLPRLLKKNRPKLQKMHPQMQHTFATRAACQIVGDWLPALIQLNYRGHQGQQKTEGLSADQNSFIPDAII